MMKQKFAIIGDIYGEADRLASLVKEIEGRTPVFVGDYINRGRNPKQTLEYLTALRETTANAVFLLGNHEQGLLAYLNEDLPFYKFAGMGGLTTLKSYLPHASRDVRAEFIDVFPHDHREFLAGCPDYFETADFIVSHCGINPASPSSRTRADMVTGSHEELFLQDLNFAKVVICGHYTQASRRPYERKNFVCLDTGCGTAGGPLTALLLPEHTFIQR